MRKKKEGVIKAMEETKKKLKTAEKIKIEEKEIIIKRDKFWFEKYRWSFTRNGKLIIAGKDATTNELIEKNIWKKMIYIFIQIFKAQRTLY
jgi:predicted ribosome quality control (RQC) complex YloA/Tae2 family protein